MTEAPTQPHFLEVRNLRIEARGDSGNRLTLVDDVSFSLDKGEVLGLVGQSGAGKSTIGLSTLVYARAGCQITGGEIVFRGHQLRELKADGRQSLRGAKVAYVAQNAAVAFNPAHTLYDQVCEIALQHGAMTPNQARMEAIRLFKELDLPNPEMFGNRYPHQISRGQLQRAMVAMAMIAKPELLVLDEPLAELNSVMRVQILASLKKLIREQGITALYLGDDLAMVAQIADRIMVLRDGKIVELGDTSQILREPQTEYTRMLVAERAATEGDALAAFHRVDAEAEPILAVRDLVVIDNDGSRVLDGVSIDVTHGATLAAIGEVGTGYSPLARVVLGRMLAQGGEVLFRGKSLPARREDRDRDLHRRMQLVSKRPDLALNPRQTVLGIVGRPVAFYFGKGRRAVRARVEELLRQMELPPELLSRRADSLTIGQKQRVCIARALAAEPDLIVCENVTAAVDPLEAEHIVRLLRQSQEQTGAACLFVTQDLCAVRRLAGKVAVVQKGQLVAYGPTRQVFNPSYHPYTELLLSSVPEIRPDWLDTALQRRRKASR